MESIVPLTTLYPASEAPKKRLDDFEKEYDDNRGSCANLTDGGEAAEIRTSILGQTPSQNCVKSA